MLEVDGEACILLGESTSSRLILQRSLLECLLSLSTPDVQYTVQCDLSYLLSSSPSVFFSTLTVPIILARTAKATF